MASFTAAVVQAAAAGFDIERGLDRVGELAAEASAGGAALAVFPDAFLPGYPRGITFGTVVGDRTPEGREQFRRYFDAAVDVPGPASTASPGSRAEHRAAPGDRRDRARRRHAVLHGAVLRARRALPRQAPQADADGGGADDLGLRRRLDAAGGRHAARPHRRGDLLGELHAAAADGDVRQGRRDLLRADRRRPRHVAADDAAHRARGPLLRAVLQPVRAPQRLPGGLSRTRSRDARRRPDRAAAAASSARSARCSPARTSTARRS